MLVRLTGIGAVAVIIGLTAGCKGDLSAPAGSGTYIVVSPADLHGWQLVTNKTGKFPYNPTGDRASTASYRFRNGPGRPPAGTGSLVMQIGNEPNSRVAALAPAVAGTRLGSMTSVSYSTYLTRVRKLLPITFKIAIAPVKGPSFSTLVFDPSVQAEQRPKARRWQAWTPLAGTWQATGLSSGRCSQECSWSAVKKVMGARSIINGAYFELGASREKVAGAAAALDKVVINGTTYDMEKHPPASPPPEAPSKVPVTG